MPTYSPISPRTTTGALIQLNREIIGVLPYITLFQYNPESIRHSYQIKGVVHDDYLTGDRDYTYLDSKRKRPILPGETFSFKLDLDATDDLELGRPLTVVNGVADRLAALERLVYPTAGLVGDIAALAGLPVTLSVPIVLLVLGPARILPVWISSLSITETAHNPALMPIHAEVDVDFEVIVDQELSGDTPGLDILAAKAVYKMYRLNTMTLSLLHANSVVTDALDNVGVLDKLGLK